MGTGDIAPDFEKKTPEGDVLRLSEIDSELVLLDFWAGWCKPCLKTIKDTLIPLHNKYDTSELQIVGISYDESKSKWKKSIERFEVPWLHIWDNDDQDLYKKYSIEVIPTYYLINRQGRIVAANMLSSDLEKIIDEQLSN